MSSPAVNIQVTVKARPLIKREKDSKQEIKWKIQGNTIQQIEHNEPFIFDHIFDESSTSHEVFDTVVKPIVAETLKGINGTIFAYGQTSSGKTYTMLGDDNQPGIMVLAVQEIFNEIEKSDDREFLLTVGYIEIYNEKVRDLLNKDEKCELKIQDLGGEIQVNHHRRIVNSVNAVLQVMQEGNRARKFGETNMNQQSSRSHTMFRIIIESKEIASSDESNQETDDHAVRMSCLNLVDLAGSERAAQTGATGSRHKEGCYINKSLLSLGCVIQKLSENETDAYINYRDSKLTRILQASLGGNAMTAFICTISPAAIEETQSTLCFATRAKAVKNKPTVNEFESESAMLKRLKKEINELRRELAQMKNDTDRDALVEKIKITSEQIISSHRHQKDLRRRTWCPSVKRTPEIDRTLMPPPLPTTKLLKKGSSLTPLMMPIKVTQHTDEEFLPSCEVNFDLPTSVERMEPMFSTPTKCVTKSRQSFSPMATNWPKRVRQLEHELEELEEFTKLEQNVGIHDERDEITALKEELKDAYAQLMIHKEEHLELLHLRGGLYDIKEVAETSEQYHDLNGQLLELTKTVSDLNAQKDQLQRDNFAAQKIAKELTKSKDFIEMQKSSLEYEYEQYKTRAKVREKELLQLLDDPAPKDTHLFEQNTQLKQQLKESETKNWTFEQTIKQMENENKELIEKLNRCSLEMNEKKLEAYTSEIMDLKNEILALKMDSELCGKLKIQIKTLSEKNDKLQSEYDELSNQFMDSVQENDSARKTIGNMELSIDQLREKLSAFQSLQEKSVNLEIELTEAEIRMEKIQLEYDDAKNQIDNLQEDLKTMTCKNEVNERDKLSYLQQLEETKQKFKSTLNNLLELQSAFELEKKRLNNSVEALAVVIKELNNSNSDLKQTVSEQREAIIRIQDSNTATEKEVNDLKNLNIRLKNEIDHLKAELIQIDQTNFIIDQVDAMQVEIKDVYNFLDDLALLQNELQHHYQSVTLNINTILNSQNDHGIQSHVSFLRFLEQYVDSIEANLMENGTGKIDLKPMETIKNLENIKNSIDVTITLLKKMCSNIATFDGYENVILLDSEKEDQTEVLFLKAEIADKNNMIDELKTINSDLCSRNTEIQLERDEINMRFDQTTSLQNECQNLSSKLKKMEVLTDLDKQNSTKYKKSLTNKIFHLTQDVKMLNHELSIAQNQKAVALNAEKDLQNKLDEMKVEIDQLQTEKDQLHQTEQNLIIKLNELTIKNDRLQLQNTVIKEQLNELNENGKNLQMKVNDLSMKNDRLNTQQIARSEEKCQYALMEEKCSNLTMEKDQLLHEINQINIQKFKTEDSLQAKIKNLKANAEKLKQEFEISKEENVRYSQLQESLQTKITNLIDENATLKQQIESVNHEKNALYTVVENNRTVIRETEDECNSMRLLASNIQALQDQNGLLKVEIDNLRAELLKGNSDNLQDFESEKSELETKNSNLKAYNETLSEELTNYVILSQTKDLELQQLRKEKTEFDQLKNEQISKLEHFQSQISNLEQSILTLKIDNGKLQAENCVNLERNNDLFGKNQHLQNCMSTAQQQRVDFEQKLNAMEQDNLQLQNANKSLKEQRNNFQQQISKMDKELQQLLDEKRTLQRNIEVAKEQSSILELDNDDLRNKLAELQTKHGNSTESHKMISSLLQNQIDALQQEKERNLQMFNNLNETIDKLKNERTELNDKINVLHIENQTHKSSYSNLQSKYDVLIEDNRKYESRNHELTQICSNHREQIKQFTISNEKLKNSNSELSKKCNNQSVENQTTKSSHSNLESKYNKLIKENDTREANLNQKIKELTEKCLNQDAQIKQFAISNVELKNSNSELCIKLNEQSNLLKMTEKQRFVGVNSKGQNDNIIIMENRKQNEIGNKLQTEINKLTLDNNELNAKLTNIEKDLKQSKAKNSKLLEKFDELQSKLRSDNSFDEKDLETKLQQAENEKELRKTMENRRKSRRNSTYDESRQIKCGSSDIVYSRDCALQTDPTNIECNCEEMDKKIKELTKESLINKCHLGTLKMKMENHPLGSENMVLKKKLSQCEMENFKLRRDIGNLNSQLQQSFAMQDCLNCVQLKSKRTASKDTQTQFFTDLQISNSSGFVIEMENNSLKENIQKLQKKYHSTKMLCISRGEANEVLKKELNALKLSKLHSEVDLNRNSKTDNCNENISQKPDTIINCRKCATGPDDKENVPQNVLLKPSNIADDLNSHNEATNVENAWQRDSETDKLKDIIDEIEEELRVANERNDKLKTFCVQQTKHIQYLEDKLKTVGKA